MCGIIAYLSQSQKKLFRALFDGLQMIQNRGYDSAGICSVNGDKFITHKFASSYNSTALDKLKNYDSCYDDCCIGISHTRWAHGTRSIQQAPFCSLKK